MTGRHRRQPVGTGAPAVDRFRIRYVCTGNICRSPMAERITRRELQLRLGPDAERIQVDSAGTWGHEGAAMESHAAAVLAEYGADIDDFRGRELLDEHVAEADLVLTFTRDHRAQVISMGYAAGLRTFTLKEFHRLVAAIDPASLPTGDVVARARTLVRAAAALRGWLLASSPEADEIDDPYGAPLTVFRDCGQEISTAVGSVLTVLTGTARPVVDPRPVP
ncbi:arsenate reductase/protein-tyrosine-phosphatase family protein [Allostreptomyces psammosilenae]|uniref:protein-tyrosine-phosphatase n=1 Tax=Allostreptomyces psammosilenae TaxID=1892865 RepID=A0A853A7J8_9ACTN|nr:protein-tyrosine-phosphatase [Allostreptomyces psammosilenae]NYI06422.1 protein-tyrosine phosphatase [Allostreptomyces psammosilenae]